MKIKKLFTIVFAFLMIVSSGAVAQRNASGEDRILIFTKTKGFYHKAIPAGVTAMQKIASENNIVADTTKNSDLFTPENLKKYKAVVFLSTTGDVLNEAQQKAFTDYIKSGGGFMGVHAAADTEYEWPWYNQLVGAYFLSHPKTQQATIKVVDKSHPATAMLPDEWTRTDEWYNYKNIQPGLNVVAKLDESSYEGGKNGDDHPIAWYREFDGGRMFYTGLGHTDESYQESLFLAHLTGGLQYAMGTKKMKNKSARKEK